MDQLRKMTDQEIRISALEISLKALLSTLIRNNDIHQSATVAKKAALSYIAQVEREMEAADAEKVHALIERLFLVVDTPDRHG